MKAIHLIKYGAPENAFEIREVEKPTPTKDQILIKVTAFGLNYADVMARLGLYEDAPPLPAILGYDVVGEVSEVGANVKGFAIGQRVTAMTRFGGYAEYAITDPMGTTIIDESISDGEALALTTQGCTAYYGACELVNLFEGDSILIHAGAGGVGTALIQLAKHKKCTVFATAGSAEKIAYLKQLGVDHPINYREKDFYKEVIRLSDNKGVDVAFDAVGGANFKKSKSLLKHGGRIITYGAAERKSGIINSLKLLFGFGFMHPIGLLMQSKSVLGLNMLRIADHQPTTLNRCLKNVMTMAAKGVLKPHIGATYKATEIAQAHSHLGNRKSIGKIVMEW